MTNIAIANTEGLPRSLALTDDELLPVLASSLYPGAKSESIKLVLGYCRAAGLDPMQKPVHIVPMNTKKPGTNQYEWRDVVMPGIGLYRTQAARTGQLAGIDEPDFGPEIPMPLSAAGKTVPEWCRVTVYRMIGGQRVGFTAREYWVENYATGGSNNPGPNAMWARRPRGQLAKCAEAQALRKAFPEIGSQPTADETMMEPGEVFDAATGAPLADAPAAKVQRKPRPSPAADPAPGPDDGGSAGGQAEDPAVVTDATIVRETARPPAAAPTPAPAPASAPAAAPAAGGEVLVGAGEIAYLKNKARAIGANIEDVLADAGGLVLDKLTKADFQAVKARLVSME